ncbi:MAG: IS21-like element helper ATPase IstB, partial [Polyangiales bacterium]
MTSTTKSSLLSLTMMLRTLKLPTMHDEAEHAAERAIREGWSFTDFLHYLCELELNERGRRRVERNLRASNLPAEKTDATLQRKKLPLHVARMLSTLFEGEWVKRGENLLIFGLPGRGKTHLACAIGHELVRRGHRVLFTATYSLVQRLLQSKRDLRLQKELDALDSYELVILDDIGYVQQSREEMEVLFTFLAERYEHRSVAITSNLVFSEWGKIFKDEMTTAAAIDRVVHHSIILEMNNKSVRAEQAEEALRETTTTPA